VTEVFFSFSWESIYYFGIIDYLIRYDVIKQVESVIKRTVAKKEDISSVGPQDYANRFVSNLEKKKFGHPRMIQMACFKIRKYSIMKRLFPILQNLQYSLDPIL